LISGIESIQCDRHRQGGIEMGSKGRKNEKKPKQAKQKPEQKQAAGKK
jgi:hypothetical protein